MPVDYHMVDLIAIRAPEYDVDLDIRYATENNITGAALYQEPRCYLRIEAAEQLTRAIELAKALGVRLHVFDGYRPVATQHKLWQSCPDPDYIVPPEVGSNHTRAIAVDLTLAETNGTLLDMGTGFDDMSQRSHHGNTDISTQIQRNRYLLHGLMASAGWVSLPTEWWHYQLDGEWPLISEDSLTTPLAL